MRHWLEIYYPRRMGATAPAATSYDIPSLSALLRSVGFRSDIIPYLLAQVLHETENLTSNLFRNYNNFSGIKYVKQKRANGKHGAFATYASPQDWAADYYRVLNLSPGRPAGATSAQDFHTRLLANNYYGTRTAGSAIDQQYVTGFNSALKKVNAALPGSPGASADWTYGSSVVDDKGKVIPPAQRAIDEKVYALEHPQFLETLKAHPLLAGIGLTVVGIIVIKAINN
jgi:hypothetical protein